MKRLICLALFCSACGSSPSPSPVAPAPVPPTVADCQAHNTAAAKFGNRSTSNTTMDVFWDGSKIFTLTPGQDSEAFNVAAGVAHRMEFRVTNSTLLACNVSNPIPAQCAFPLYTCSF